MGTRILSLYDAYTFLISQFPWIQLLGKVIDFFTNTQN